MDSCCCTRQPHPGVAGVAGAGGVPPVEGAGVAGAAGAGGVPRVEAATTGDVCTDEVERL